MTGWMVGEGVFEKTSNSDPSGKAGHLKVGGRDTTGRRNGLSQPQRRGRLQPPRAQEGGGRCGPEERK